MKRKITIPSKPFMAAAPDRQPRERRTLGLKFDLVAGEGVSGLR